MILGTFDCRATSLLRTVPIPQRLGARRERTSISGRGIFWRARAALERSPVARQTDIRIIRALNSFTDAGEQYLTVLVGYRGAGAVSAPAEIRRGGRDCAQSLRVLALKLSMSSPPPTTPAHEMAVNALDSSALQLDLVAVARGARNFGGHYTACHDRGAASPDTPAPDLRKYPIAFDREAHKRRPPNGGIESTRVPRFDMIEERIRDVHMFIGAVERKALRPAAITSKPTPPSPIIGS